MFPSKNMNVCLTFCEQQQQKKKKKRKDYFWPLRQSENTIWGCGVIVSFCESLDFAFAVVQLSQRAFWSRSSCVGKAETEEHGLHCPTALEAHAQPAAPQPAAPRKERARGSPGYLQSDSRHRVHLLVVLTQAPCCSAHKLGRAGAE